MKMNSISGLKYTVSDLQKTTQFYEALGFRMGNQTDESATCYVNWFWITFVPETGGEQGAKGAGQSLHIKVDDIDEFYQGVIAKDMKPENEPAKQPSGNIEFTLNDPDGYKLVFFFKK